MRLTEERIKSLQVLMREKLGSEMTNEQAHEAGLAIMRFLIAKTQRKQELMKDVNYELKRPD
jgi:hypothetical protein